MRNKNVTNFEMHRKRNWIRNMNRITRLKYTGVIAGAGLAVVLFSSGVYAHTSSKAAGEETKAEIEVISLDLSQDLSENHFYIEQADIGQTDMEQASAEEYQTAENDAIPSAGAGDVLENIEEETGDTIQSSDMDEPSESSDDTTEPEPSDEFTEPESSEVQDELELSAGAGAVFEQAGEEAQENAVQAMNIEVQEETEPETHSPPKKIKNRGRASFQLLMCV